MLDIGASVELGIDQHHIVVARRPMQRRFPVPHADGRRVEIGAGRGERLHDRGGVRSVPGPIGEQMQQRPPAAFGILDHAVGEPWLGRKQPAQQLYLALLERCRDFHGKRLIASQPAGIGAHRRLSSCENRSGNPPAGRSLPMTAKPIAISVHLHTDASDSR
jgi:hypothetical protein